jgi:hypothetical protein
MLLLIALILCAAGVWGACVTPTEDYSVTGSIVLCTGTYQLNDTAGNGAIIIGAADATLNCNNSIIRGNRTANSRGISSNYANTAILNCNLVDYYDGIYIQQPGADIYDNNVINATKDGIFFGASADIGAITSNNITNTYQTFTNQQSGITLYQSDYIDVAYNNIDGYYTGFKNSNNLYGSFVSNNISNTNYTAIYVGAGIGGANYSLYENNTVINAGHNGIDIDGFYNTVKSNTFTNSKHHGIDLFLNTYNATSSGYNNISFNTIQNVKDTNANGIYIGSSNYNNIFNNTILNITNGAYASGIHADGNATISQNNFIYNNTVNGASYCLWNDLNSTKYQDNVLQSCATAEAIVKNSFYPAINSTPIFTNNAKAGQFRVYADVGNIAFTICSSLNCATYTPTAGQTWNVSRYTGCTMPISDYATAADTTFCDGNYHIFDDGVTEGVLRNPGGYTYIGYNVTLNGNGTGSGLRNQFSGSHRGTFVGFTVKNYTQCVDFNTADNMSAINITVERCVNGFKIFNGADDANVTGSYIFNNTPYGMWLSGTNRSNFNDNQFMLNNYSIYGGYNVANSIRVLRNNITNSYGAGVELSTCYGCNISYNRVINPDYTNSTYNAGSDPVHGIAMPNNALGIDNYIEYNIINGFYYNRFSAVRTYVRYNNASNSGSWTLSIDANDSQLIGNRVENSSWNLLHFSKARGLISNNYLKNYRHDGIDSHSDLGLADEIAFDANITNNFVTQDRPDLFGFDSYACLAIGECARCRVLNNTCRDIINNGTWQGSRGIGLGNGNLSSDVLVANNTLWNVSGNCVSEYGHNNTIINNTFAYCGEGSANWSTISFAGPWKTDPAFLYTNDSNLATVGNNTYIGFTPKFTIGSYRNITTAITVQEAQAFTFVQDNRKNFATINVYSSLNNVTYTPDRFQTWVVNKDEACRMPSNTTFGQQGVNWCDGQYYLKNGNSFLLFADTFAQAELAVTNNDIFSRSYNAQVTSNVVGAQILPNVKNGKTACYMFRIPSGYANQNVTVNMNLSRIVNQSGWTGRPLNTSIGLTAGSVFGGLFNESIPYSVT